MTVTRHNKKIAVKSWAQKRFSKLMDEAICIHTVPSNNLFSRCLLIVHIFAHTVFTRLYAAAYKVFFPSFRAAYN